MESSEVSFDHTLNATNALYIRPLRTPNVVELPPGVVKPQDLPLDPIKNVKLKRLVDIIGEVNFPEAKRTEITNTCLQGRFHDLAEPFGFKKSPERNSSWVPATWACSSDITVYKIPKSNRSSKPHECNKGKGKQKAMKNMKSLKEMKSMKSMKKMNGMKMMKGMKSMKAMKWEMHVWILLHV